MGICIIKLLARVEQGGAKKEGGGGRATKRRIKWD